jgi:uncharacterized NAD-dependent epimerase/dehydratase family protein
VALTVNTATMEETAARDYARKAQDQLHIPVILPLEDGVATLVPIFEAMIKKSMATV